MRSVLPAKLLNSIVCFFHSFAPELEFSFTISKIFITFLDISAYTCNSLLKTRFHCNLKKSHSYHEFFLLPPYPHKTLHSEFLRLHRFCKKKKLLILPASRNTWLATFTFVDIPSPPSKVKLWEHDPRTVLLPSFLQFTTPLPVVTSHIAHGLTTPTVPLLFSTFLSLADTRFFTSFQSISLLISCPEYSFSLHPYPTPFLDAPLHTHTVQYITLRVHHPHFHFSALRNHATAPPIQTHSSSLTSPQANNDTARTTKISQHIIDTPQYTKLHHSAYTSINNTMASTLSFAHPKVTHAHKRINTHPLVNVTSSFHNHIHILTRTFVCDFQKFIISPFLIVFLCYYICPTEFHVCPLNPQVSVYFTMNHFIEESIPET